VPANDKEKVAAVRRIKQACLTNRPGRDCVVPKKDLEAAGLGAKFKSLLTESRLVAVPLEELAAAVQVKLPAPEPDSEPEGGEE